MTVLFNIADLSIAAGFCALLCVTGCASVYPSVNAASVRDDVRSAPQEIPPAPPGWLPLDLDPVSARSRPFEIPSGFVRQAVSTDARPRREAETFDFVQRRISCADAWAVAVKAGTEAGLDPALLFGIMRVESSLTVNVISYAGAIGLMQVMAGPAARLGCGDLLDPLENARCGAIILSRFLKRFDNRMVLGLSAYNAGFGMPGRARKKSTIPQNFNYPENVLRVRAKFLRWGCAPWE